MTSKYHSAQKLLSVKDSTETGLRPDNLISNKTNLIATKLSCFHFWILVT